VVVLAVVRLVACAELKKDAAKGPDVTHEAESVMGLLWSHVPWSAHLGGHGGLEGLVEGVRNAHVNYLDLLLIVCHHDVAGLQVLVDDSFLMQVIDPADELATDSLDLLERVIFVLFDEVGEIASIAVLDDQVGLMLFLGPVVRSHEVLVLDDVGVVEVLAYRELLKLLLDILLSHLIVRERGCHFVDKDAVQTLDGDFVSFALVA